MNAVPLRILQCIESMNPAFGGTVSATVDLTLALEARDVECEILTLDGPGEHWDAGIPRSRYHCAGPPYSFYRYCPGLQESLHERLARYDAVIIHGLWRHHSAGVWWALRRIPRPYYVYVHSMLHPWFNHEGALKHFRKTLFWKAVEHRVLRDAHRVLFLSEQERLLNRESFQPYSCKEAVAPLGTDDPAKRKVGTEAFYTRWPGLRGQRVVLFLGRLHPIKGCDLLIEAFARVARAHPDVRLVIAGPDWSGLCESLERLAHERGIAARVFWVGPIYGEEKWSALAATELLALPSHAEGFPFSVLEALGCSVPVLITDKTGIHDIVQADDAGLVATDTVDSIADHLGQWLGRTPEQRLHHSRRARQCFLDHFHRDRAADRLLALFREDLGLAP